MKAITIKQPYASLILGGLKDIENRTWPTKFRGKVLVHSAKVPVNGLYCEVVTDLQYANIVASKNMGLLIKCPDGVILGTIDIVDCVINHPSIWAEKTVKSQTYNQKPIFNWVLANPFIFPEPIPAKGKLSFWDYPNIIAEPEEENGELFCHCQLPVKESNQVMSLAGEYRCIYCFGKWYK